jgi:DNA polymerase III subunit epsilon
MTWLAPLFRSKTVLSPATVRVVEAWRTLPAPSDHESIGAARFVVVDVETSGLNPRRDRLLSIGAVSVEHMRAAPRAAFHAVVRNETPTTRENVAVHGLTPARQAAGVMPARALSEFLGFIRKAPCVAFHAGFDRAVLDRALRAELGVRLSNPWVDLAELLPALFPEARLIHGVLDKWLGYFRLHVHARHDAVHDAAATAELLLIALARAGRRGISTLAQLRAAAHAHRNYHRT